MATRRPGAIVLRSAVLEAVNADSGVSLTELKVDGGMVANEALMQFQADILGVAAVRPRIVETTALGAAYAAGLAIGFWKDLGELTANCGEDKRWTPKMDDAERFRQLRLWKKRSPSPWTGSLRT
jgi:glycerol kinase